MALYYSAIPSIFIHFHPAEWYLFLVWIKSYYYVPIVKWPLLRMCECALFVVVVGHSRLNAVCCVRVCVLFTYL